MGGVYGLAAPVFGMVCDRYSPRFVALIGAVFLSISFALMGPLPFLGISKSIAMIKFTLVLQGIGQASQLVSGFAIAQRQAAHNGLPESIDTYGQISGLFTSVFALGAFVGPTLGGVLFDSVGFAWACMFIIGNQLLVIVLLVGLYLCAIYKSRKNDITREASDNGGEKSLLIESSGTQR